jgi:phage-related protein
MEKLPAPARPLFWVGSSRKDYRDFPPAVQDSFGFELFLAQLGQHPPSAKLLKGLGSGTVELVEDFDGDTYRRLHRSLWHGCLCAARVQKEIETRHQNTPKRH